MFSFGSSHSSVAPKNLLPWKYGVDAVKLFDVDGVSPANMFWTNLAAEFLIADFSITLLFGVCGGSLGVYETCDGVEKSIKYTDLFLARLEVVGVVGGFTMPKEFDPFSLLSFWSIDWNATVAGVPQFFVGERIGVNGAPGASSFVCVVGESGLN